jgi:hypothetical protein
MDSLPAAVVTNSEAAGFAYSLGAADISGDGILDGLVSMPFGECSNGVSGPAGEVFAYDFSVDLPARAFVQGASRAIPLGQGEGLVTIRFEPIGASYNNADVDMSTIVLVSDASGEVRRIHARVARRSVASDTDGDGVPELPALFSVSDLQPLFGTVRGRSVINAHLQGKLISGRQLGAPISLTVLGIPMVVHGPSTVVSPNPLNPVGTLQFVLPGPGTVSVYIFDIRGGLVRTVLSSQPLAAGPHFVLLDGKDARGITLASGPYFYVIKGPGGRQYGRFVITK